MKLYGNDFKEYFILGAWGSILNRIPRHLFYYMYKNFVRVFIHCISE